MRYAGFKKGKFMKVHLLERNPHELLISTANRNTLEIAKLYLDGSKVYKKNQIVAIIIPRSNEANNNNSLFFNNFLK